MTSVVSKRGGLYIVGAPADEAAIQRELRKRDPNLFLDWEAHPGRNGRPVKLYSVNYSVADGHVKPLLWWTDEYGNPQPLSSSILDALDSQRREISKPAKQRIAENQARREAALDKERDEHYDWIERKVRPRIGTTRVLDGIKMTVPMRARKNELERQKKLAARRRS
jgi:hypothetical protein